jgi:hypothetical protein
MSSYSVTTPFQAFDRQYKPGEVLTDADMACWLPEEDRALVVDGLVQFGKLVPLSADASNAGYPATWGSAAPAEPAHDEPQPEPPPEPEPALEPAA